MGKKGDIELILPKNSGDKKLLEDVINIVFKNNHEISSEDFKNEMMSIMENENLGSDITSVIHKAVMPRYFGLLEFKNKLFSLTEFGINYAKSTSSSQKIDILFDAIETISFGRGNNAVSSDSNIDPPIVFLKMLKDLQSCSITQFGCMLFYLEVMSVDYQIAIKDIENHENINLEKENIKKKGGGKFFDPKFHLFFESLGLIEMVPNTRNFQLSHYVKSKYADFIDELVILNSKESKTLELNFEKSKKERIDTSNSIREFIKDFDKKSNYSKPFIYFAKHNQLSKSKKSNLINYGRNKKNNKFTDEDKFQIGWRGEKYLYYLLTEKDNLLLEELKFSANETLLSVDWFNFGFEKSLNWIDKSIGQGYDIDVKTSLRNLKIEVKTSWDNVNYYTVTTNELKSMKNNEYNYFLIKINKLFNTISDSINPKLTVINNPILALNNIDNIKTVTLYTAN